MKKLIRSPFAEIDLSLDGHPSIGGCKQYNWVFRVPKNGRKLFISATRDDRDGITHYGYQWETAEPVVPKPSPEAEVKVPKSK